TRRSSDLVAEFEPGADSELKLRVNDVPVFYNAAKRELSVNGHHVPAPLRGGKQRITIISDRTAMEVFASDGLVYVPLPVVPKGGNAGATVALTGAALKSQQISGAELRSIWK